MNEGTKVVAMAPALLPDKLPATPQSAMLTMGTEPLGSGGFSKVRLEVVVSAVPSELVVRHAW